MTSDNGAAFGGRNRGKRRPTPSKPGLPKPSREDVGGDVPDPAWNDCFQHVQFTTINPIMMLGHHADTLAFGAVDVITRRSSEMTALLRFDLRSLPRRRSRAQLYDRKESFAATLLVGETGRPSLTSKRMRVPLPRRWPIMTAFCLKASEVEKS